MHESYLFLSLKNKHNANVTFAGKLGKYFNKQCYARCTNTGHKINYQKQKNKFYRKFEWISTEQFMRQMVYIQIKWPFRANSTMAHSSI